MDAIRAIVDASVSLNMTQKEFAECTGVNQVDIANQRMEQEITLLICLKGQWMAWEWLLRLSLYRNKKYDSQCFRIFGIVTKKSETVFTILKRDDALAQAGALFLTRLLIVSFINNFFEFDCLPAFADDLT